MEGKDLETVVRTLALLAECEEAVAGFYGACAEAWPEERAFWAGIAEEERGHARNLLRMRELVACRPQDYCLGRAFSPFAVRTMIEGVRRETSLVRAGRLSASAASLRARDLEKSLIERCYHDVLHSTDREYNTLLRQITEQTARHAARFMVRVAVPALMAAYVL